MDKKILFFSYNQCYEYYKKRIEYIRQKKINGETIVAKPVLILALIDGVESGEFTANRFSLNEWLEKRYLTLMKQYTRNSQFYETTNIEKPFWHLESDDFWHLDYQGERLSKGRTPSKAWLKENVKLAYFDESLWILLQSKEWRIRLRDYIVENKLK